VQCTKIPFQDILNREIASHVRAQDDTDEINGALNPLFQYRFFRSGTIRGTDAAT